MQTEIRHSPQAGRPRGFLLFCAAALVLAVSAALPVYARGTPEDTWQEATGNEVWRHDFDLSTAEPGVHNVIIRARDAAGNVALEGPYNIRIDPNVGLPVVRIVYPGKDTVLRRDVHIIGVAGGRNGVGRVELKIDDGAYAAADGTDYWSVLVDSAALKDGKHTVTAKAADPRGSEGKETSVVFVLDREPPSVRITSHESGALVSGNVEMVGGADDANGIAKLELSVDGGGAFEELKFRSVKGETAVTFSFPVQSRKIADGATIYQIRAEDGTGAISTHPFLFFVDNEPPKLEILAPAEDAKVFGAFRITGTMQDVVGVKSLSYVFNKESQEIEMRPGDPYWTADIALPPGTGRSVEVEFTAVDKSGNKATVKRRFQNDIAAASPNVSITYPAEAILAAFPPDGAVFGRIEGGFKVESIEVEGGKSYPAKPAFRIPSSDIGPGRTDLRIRARTADGISGGELRIRVARPAVPANTVPPPVPETSRITVDKPEAFAYFSSAFNLSGRAEGTDRLEYRLGPEEPWREIGMGAGGAFAADVSLEGIADGPVHLEIRTSAGGAEYYPVYNPVNKHSAAPEIVITAPRRDEVVNGSVTVSGEIVSAAPIAEISYTLDGKTYKPLDAAPNFAGASFSVVADFTALDKEKGALEIRVVDAAGNAASAGPLVRVDGEGDLPTVQLNLPADNALITDDFTISGMAFDDDGVAAVYWKIGEGKFEKITAEQSFRVDVPLSAVKNGEQKIEVYAEDAYGLAGPPVSAAIRVSTDSPTVNVTEPDFKIYNRGTVFLRGTANDQNGIAEVRVSMDNGSSFQIAEGTESWSLPLNTAAYIDGVYSVLVVAADTFGVESRISSLLSIDNTPPVVSIGEPADGRVTGPSLRISGQLSDNIGVESLSFELSSTTGTQRGLQVDMEPKLVILETIDISSLPSGKYNLRMIAADAAGNSSVVVRNLELAKETGATSVVIFNPLPGIVHTGPLKVTGRVTGPQTPGKIGVYEGGRLLAEADVDRFGFFHHEMTEHPEGDRIDLSAGFTAVSGEAVKSVIHPVYLQASGPVVFVDSHRTGDAVTSRPWLRGKARMELTPEEKEAAGKRAEKMYEVSRVLVSLDNGRSFLPAKGGEDWRFRLETGELPRGPLPILVKAEFADGRSAVERIVLTVDTTPPVITLVAPEEGSLHADSLLMYGTAMDEYGLEKIEVNLRPGDKSGYAIPQFIQGLYLDTHVFGSTYADVGLGVSFFDNNVKLQLQAGVAPPGRFTGTVIGAKLIANVFLLPFEYFLGPDWSFFSMAFALGANFSYFTMDSGSDPLVMSAVLLQWEFARFEIPDWKNFRTISLYLEPNFWFAASDVSAGAVFRMSLGLRLGIF